MKKPWKGAALMVGMAVALTGLTVCASLSPAADPACEGVCYRINGGQNAMVILGSIHVGDQSMTRFFQPIRQAMEAADVFVFECDTESAEAQKAMNVMTKADEPLAQKLSPQTYALLAQAADALGLSMTALNDLRPWAVTSRLSTQAAAAELGVQSAAQALAYGVENTVRKAMGSRQTAYLETAAEQLEVLDGFSPQLQEEMLKSACQQLLDPQTTTLKEWPEWWRQGNEAAFAAAYAAENEPVDPALAAEYHQGLVTRRNQRMAEGLAALLEGAQPHTYFVTLGVLHLVLPGDSVLSELEAMGYTAERVK